MSAHKKAAEQILEPLTNDEKDLLAGDRDMQLVTLIGMTRANALATLELAEQQRIANIIAFTEATGGMWASLRETITDELGI